MRATFKIQLGRVVHDCGSLRQCQAALIAYRNNGSTHCLGGLRSSEFLEGDGRVWRNNQAAGCVSYNGRYWRHKHH